MHLMLFSLDDQPNGAAARWWPTLIALIAVAVVVLLLARTIFFVDETQYVYVTQFGKPVRLYVEGGLGVKWPYQSLRRFDRRLQMYQPPGREMLTRDKENLTFEWFVCWRIPARDFVTAQFEASGRPASAADIHARMEMYVRRFLQSIGSNEVAESRLEERIQAAIAARIGNTELDELVSLDARQVQLEAIGQQITAAIRTAAAEEYGIEVVDVRLKRFNYPEEVKPAVYAEIRSERARVAVQYRAEGASDKQKIESLADLQRDQLLARARREATAMRGEGDARAIEIYNAAHSKNPQFYELLKTLETYRTILDDQTTVVLSADSPLLKLLTRGMPNLSEMPQTLPGSEPSASETPPTTAGATATPATPEPRVANNEDEQ